MPQSAIRILLIDGDELAFLNIQTLLGEVSGTRFEVEWVEGYQAGAEAIREARHDVYLIDHDLDEESGLELIRATVRGGCTPPLILMTSRASGAIDLAAIQAGAADSLVKDDLTSSLLARVIIHSLERCIILRQLQDREDALSRLAGIVESSDDAIISKTLDGSITSWNHGAERLYGYSASEAIGRSMSLIVPPDRMEELAEIFAKLADGERIDAFDTVRVRKDGSLVSVSVSISPIRDASGRVIGASKTAHDISDRLRARQRRDTQYAVTRVLSEARTLQEAAPAILGAVARGLGWDVGQMWTADPANRIIRRVGTWTPDETPDNLSALNAYPTFTRGVGLPGKVWERGQPQWIWEIENLSRSDWPRMHDARAEGFRAAFAFPLRDANQTIGVLELFTREDREPDADLLNVVTALGSQIGQFIERTRTETALRETEEQFRLLLDSTAEGIYGLDLKGRCTFANPAAARILGYERPEDLLGRKVHALMHHTRADGTPYPADSCHIYQAFLRGQGTHVDDEVFWRADGTSIPVEYFSHPIRKRGKVVGAVVTFLDITERLRSTNALATTEARFRNLAEASFDAISVSEAGVLVEVNRGFELIFGASSEQAVGRQVIEFVAEESREFVRRRIESGIEGTYEFVGVRHDGRKVTLEATAKTHRIAGRTERITAVRDMTERRLMEAQLRQAQKMEAVGRLAGGVAHDFNNLLTVITAYVGLLLEDLASGDPRREDIGEIGKAATAAAGLTRQLLAFSRQQVIAPRIVALEEIVANSEKLLARLLGEDIEVVTTLGNSAMINIDPGQLEQVIMNLAVNARDAMPTGGKLMMETEIAEFDEQYALQHPPAMPGHFAMLAMTDTGSGMDQETQAHIFEPFFTTKPEGRGTGLGLATVYGIVKQNHGFIWVYSEVGVGTTFKVYFPISEQTSVTGEWRAALPPTPRGSETVLLLEDSPAVRAAARETLVRYGYTVLEATRGQLALDFARKHHGPIDLLLTDVVMPEMSGRQVAEEIGRIRPETKVLYMSGYTADAVLRHGVLDHGIAYLQKPFTPDALARKVREVLGS